MKLNRFFWGCIFILAAVFLVASHILGWDIDISPWKIIVGIALLYILFENLGKRQIFGILFSLAGLYWLFAPYLGIFKLPLVPIIPLIGAVILLSIGLSFLFGKGHKNRDCCRRGPKHGGNETKDMNDDTVYRSVSFGKSEIYLHSKNLKKGNFANFCGEVNIFFNDAQLDPAGASVDLDCTMGSLKLYVPRTWQVNEDIDVAFGAVQKKNKDNNAQGPLLSITGFVRLGQIEIVYV